MSLVLAALAAAASPKPGELKTFYDWTVGCDNGRACQAVALIPEEWPEEAVTMTVRRRPEAGAGLDILIEPRNEVGAVTLSAAGKPLPIRLLPEDGGLRISAKDGTALIAAMRTAAELELVGADGKTVKTISLAGATAALLYMDEQQKRIGTRSALIRPGPASAVPPPPALPVVVAAPIPAGAAPTLSPARLKALRKQAGCDIEEVGGPTENETVRISATHSLLLLSCGSGAYNVSYVPYLLTGRRAAVQAKLAPFDLPPSWSGDGSAVLVNAGWDAERRLLTSFGKGRGLGDCGTAESYAWDGARFRLVEQSEMGECRGSTDYITTWRAEVRR
jgi:hypothetical protein